MRAFLPDDTRLAQVHLHTTQLAAAVDFYAGVLGLELVAKTGSSVEFAANGGPVLLVLSEPDASDMEAPSPTGLYHFALRFEQRHDLAQTYQRLVRQGYPVEGASDHDVSEAIYLTDPDGHGIELYSDRPRDQWPWRDNQIAMVTRPLDTDNLLQTLDRAPAQAQRSGNVDVGHVHLHVPDLTAAERFYSEFLGFAVTQRTYPGALFFAAGGYHHHIGVNVWPRKHTSAANKTGLVSYRLQVRCPDLLFCLQQRAPLLGYDTRVPGAGQLLIQVRDPNGNWLEVQSSAAEQNGRQSPHCAKHLFARNEKDTSG